jgi:hypothetical protein
MVAYLTQSTCEPLFWFAFPSPSLLPSPFFATFFYFLLFLFFNPSFFIFLFGQITNLFKNADESIPVIGEMMLASFPLTTHSFSNLFEEGFWYGMMCSEEEEREREMGGRGEEGGKGESEIVIVYKVVRREV